MKKTLFGLALILTFASCSKEKVKGCGVCKGTGTVNCDQYGCTYTLPILFDDGTFKDVNVTESTWNSTLEGDRICF
jgi:hypothetical protein